MPYELEPRYPVMGGAVEHGYAPLVRALAGRSPVVAIDGPAAVPWAEFIPRRCGPADRLDEAPLLGAALHAVRAHSETA